MIVPRTRLILLVACSLSPAAVWAALQAEGMFLAAGIGLVLLAVMAFDAVSGKGRFEHLEVRAPDIVRMTVDAETQLQLTLHKPSGLLPSIRLGLSLPAAVASGIPDLVVSSADSHTTCTVSWPCRPLQRGRHHVRHCHVELLSVMGLWALRRRFVLNCEIRAYPNLLSGQKHLSGLFRRGEVGMRVLRKVGKGREFEQLRDYLPGDSYEDIDWKATARRRHPVSRVFQVEQAQEIYLVMDASRLSTRNIDYVRDRRSNPRGEGTAAHPGRSIFEHYITAALVMAMAADQAADRFGLLVFSNKPDCFIKAGRGRAHYNACRDALYNRMPAAVSPDFNELFTFIGTHVRKRALLLFLTHLDDPVLSENFLAGAAAVTGKHLVVVNMVRPPGAHPLFSSADVSDIGGIYQHIVGHMVWQALADTRRKLRQQGVELHFLDKESLCSQLVYHYIDLKQQQML